MGKKIKTYYGLAQEMPKVLDAKGRTRKGVKPMKLFPSMDDITGSIRKRKK